MIFTCEPVNIMPYLSVPKYAIKAAGGRFYVCQSMQEKLPVAMHPEKLPVAGLMVAGSLYGK